MVINVDGFNGNNNRFTFTSTQAGNTRNNRVRINYRSADLFCFNGFFFTLVIALISGTRGGECKEFFNSQGSTWPLRRLSLIFNTMDQRMVGQLTFLLHILRVNFSFLRQACFNSANYFTLFLRHQLYSRPSSYISHRFITRGSLTIIICVSSNKRPNMKGPRRVRGDKVLTRVMYIVNVIRT